MYILKLTENWLPSCPISPKRFIKKPRALHPGNNTAAISLCVYRERASIFTLLERLSSLCFSATDSEVTTRAEKPILSLSSLFLSLHVGFAFN